MDLPVNKVTNKRGRGIGYGCVLLTNNYCFVIHIFNNFAEKKNRLCKNINLN